MKIDELNSVLRNIFKELFDEGYKRLPIAEVTLGKSFSPQFGKFMEDTDLGYVPISRMINGLGFELCVIPIKSDDDKAIKFIQEQYKQFIKTTKNDLIDYLDNRTTSSPIRKRKSTSELEKIFDEVINDYINDIEKESI